MFTNFSKNQEGGISFRIWVKRINNQHLILLDLCVVFCGSLKCSFSVCSVISLFSCLAVNNCIANMLDFPEFLHSARIFLYQLDCWAFQGSVFKKQAILNIYLDIIEGQIFQEPMNQLSVFPWLWSTQECHQLCLDQLNSKILETPITQEKFQSLSYFLLMDIY